MVRSRHQLFWVVATWATLAAPAIPQPCDCPGDDAAGCCSQTCCAVESPQAPRETCRCHWQPRHDQPLAPVKSAAPPLDSHEPTVASTSFTIEVPQDLAVSRDYVAASLAMPIRPPRILFGVWRN